jgi:hypothetical protein
MLRYRTGRKYAGPIPGDGSPLFLAAASQKSAIVESVAHLSMELIERYALREFSAAEIQRAEKHVAKCPACEERLQEQVDSWAAMRSTTVAAVRKIAKVERKRTAKP